MQPEGNEFLGTEGFCHGELRHHRGTSTWDVDDYNPADVSR